MAGPANAMRSRAPVKACIVSAASPIALAFFVRFEGQYHVSLG
jgi:hypothetical protein